jgi:hypothetical protein
MTETYWRNINHMTDGHFCGDQLLKNDTGNSGILIGGDGKPVTGEL